MPPTGKLPFAVAEYISTLTSTARFCGYVRLNSRQLVLEAGGRLPYVNAGGISLFRSAFEQFPYLEGLLPSGDNPVVIGNARLCQDQFFDIHLFVHGEDQWVVILDNTEAAIEAQQRQQDRLSKGMYAGD